MFIPVFILGFIRIEDDTDFYWYPGLVKETGNVQNQADITVSEKRAAT